MRWLKDLLEELKARRAGAKFVKSDLGKSARAVVGPTGNMYSNGWKVFDEGRSAFMESFAPKVPPSLHVSQRDATRQTIPVPLVERCIEDWAKTTADTDDTKETP